MSVDGKKQRVKTSRANDISGIQSQESRLVKSRANQYNSQKSLCDTFYYRLKYTYVLIIRSISLWCSTINV